MMMMTVGHGCIIAKMTIQIKWYGMLCFSRRRLSYLREMSNDQFMRFSQRKPAIYRVGVVTNCINTTTGTSNCVINKQNGGKQNSSFYYVN